MEIIKEVQTMITITVLSGKNKKIIAGENGVSVMDILRSNGIFLDAPCGGHGRCGKCIVKVTGSLEPMSFSEKELLSPELLNQGFRLACFAKAAGDITVSLPTDKLKSNADTYSNYNKKSNKIGIAVDLGTTTIAITYFDIESGNKVETQSFLNPQRQYGADVISRIEACINIGTKKLKDTLILETNKNINIFCEKYSIPKEQIVKSVFAGNTVMQHILAGISPEGMASYPFTPKTLFDTEIKSKNLGLDINSEAAIYFPPCVSAFVGGDITAGMLACSFDKLNEPSLFVDIGTNGEMALLSDKGIICSSTAAGPAFEGAHIACGTGSIPGAICKVFEKNKKPLYETIGNIAPRGICGSGLIDAIAVLLDLNLIDETGALNNNQFNDKDEAVFNFNKNIFIAQHDIREIQLAKSAIVSGVETLLNYAELSPNDIKNVFIAGGFGSNINVKSACRIGLLPKQFENTSKAVGNTSLNGASMLLLEDKNKYRITDLVKRCHSIDFSKNSYFGHRFIDNMLFE